MAAIYGSDGEPIPDRPEPAALWSEPAADRVTRSAADRSAIARPADPVALHREHFVHLARLAAMIVGDRETAEDIVQDVFVRMQGRWRRLADPDRAVRYLRVSVINGARAALRRRWMAARHRAEPPADELPAEQYVLDRMRDGSVRAAVAQLPSRQQEVILLRYLEDLSIAETARVLGISSGAVKASAGRAMTTLARLLGADHDD